VKEEKARMIESEGRENRKTEESEER